MRRIGLGLLGLFGLIAPLVAGGLVYLTSRAGGERILSIALTSARKAIRGDVQAERLEFGGNRLIVHQAKLFDPEGALVAEVETIDVRLSLLSLLRRTLDIRQLNLTAPRVQLREDERGLNLSRAIEPRNPSPPQPEDKSGPIELGILLHDLAITRGAFSLEPISQMGTQQLRLDGLEARANGYYASPSQNFSVDLKLTKDLSFPFFPWLKSHKFRGGLGIFNLTNHANPRDVFTNITSANFLHFVGFQHRTFEGYLDVIY